MGAGKVHPCIGCGACCAFFRVQFYWREANKGESDHVVPAGMFEELAVSSHFRCMKGTARKHHPKCVGLNGRIGHDACCSMYPFRPSPCRDFKASYSDGRHYPRCDEARKAHGLRPLQREDWNLGPAELDCQLF